jgi:hypothetical protein
MKKRKRPRRRECRSASGSGMLAIAAFGAIYNIIMTPDA